MRALLLTANRRLELTEVDRPIIGLNDVLVRVAACGICGSDVHGYDGSSGRRIPPLVMGHEAAGTIVEKGSAVDGFEIGDRVTFDSTMSCGECAACQSGRVNLCTRRRVLGVSCDEYRQHGAFAQYVAVPQNILYPLPPKLSFEQAAMIEPVTIALHAVSLAAQGDGGLFRAVALPHAQADQLNTTPTPFSSAVVVGSGMIGLLVIQAFRVAGCRQVIAVDIDAGRLALAAELGATDIINAHQTDASSGWSSAPDRARTTGTLPQPLVVQAVLERTGGEGADVAVEVVGNAAALDTAIRSVRRGGRVVLVGNVSREVSLPLQVVVSRELTLLGSCASAGEYPRAIELVASGAIRVDPLISAIAPLAEGPQWFERLYLREPGLMKVVLQPM